MTNAIRPLPDSEVHVADGDFEGDLAELVETYFDDDLPENYHLVTVHARAGQTTIIEFEPYDYLDEDTNE